MELQPIRNILKRVDDDGSDSDVARFNALMYAGEMALKLTVLTTLAGVDAESQQERYCAEYDLVRADGVGGWLEPLDRLLAGTCRVTPEAVDDWNSLTAKKDIDSWQYECAAQMNKAVMVALGSGVQPLAHRVTLRSWMTDFVLLRNKVRAHGAPAVGVCSRVCSSLELSLRSYYAHLAIFSRPWAYLHRNFSGRYRVLVLGGKPEVFDYLKTASSVNVGDEGIFIWYEKPVLIPLLKAGTGDPSELFFPNGGYSNGRYELLSYVTGAADTAEGCVTPPGDLPGSETQSIGSLEVEGEAFTNMPSLNSKYVPRLALEEELLGRLMDDNHPIVTLVGRGGIGKTSTALSVLRKAAGTAKFPVILWFSARDMDLLPNGPKPVKPDCISQADLARAYAGLMLPDRGNVKGRTAIEAMQAALTKGPEGPTLFVFDNFETFVDPPAVYNWLDTFIRLPNKILITSRTRELKADYPVEVRGMTLGETKELVRMTGIQLQIEPLLTDAYVERIVEVADGHPYVVKMILGEVAKQMHQVPPGELIARADDVLLALFERTFTALSPAAKRVFLLISNSRLPVPEVAVEASILRYTREPIDVRQAIEELNRSSFIDLLASEERRQYFVSTPMVAAAFGQRKLAVSPYKPQVELETQLLRQFGPTRRSELSEGWGQAVTRLMHNVSAATNGDTTKLQEYVPMIECVANEYPPTWLLLSGIYEESPIPSDMEKAKSCVRRYLELPLEEADRQSAWQRLQRLCYYSHDAEGELQAWVEWTRLPSTPIAVVSEAAGRVNYMVHQREVDIAQEVSAYLVRQLADVVFDRLDECDAIGCSRAGWLFHDIFDDRSAVRAVQRGLAIDKTEEHLVRILRNPWYVAACDLAG
jgi:hypothetical protein